jgi:hypothetical protein
MGIFQSKEENNNLLEQIRETVFMKNYAWEIYEKMVNSQRIRKNLRDSLNKCINFAERMKEYYNPELNINEMFNTERSISELKVHDFAIFEFSQLFENFAKAIKKQIKQILIIYYFEKDNEFRLFSSYNQLFESHKSRDYIQNFSFFGRDDIFLKKFIEKCNERLLVNPFYTMGQSGGSIINDTIREKLRTIESLRKFDIPDSLFQIDTPEKPIKSACNLEDICVLHHLLDIQTTDCLFMEISFGIIFDWGIYRDYFRILKKYYPEMFEGTWNLPFKKRFEHILKLNLKIIFTSKAIDYSNIHLFDTRPNLQEYYKIIRQKGEKAILKSN